nr:hypothetical protein [Rhodoferax sp.]
MTNVDVESLKRDDQYCVDLAKSVWLMDNHKWALYSWESFRQQAGGDNGNHDKLLLRKAA